MRLLEMLRKSSWSMELIYTLTNYKLFIPKADKAYFWSFFPYIEITLPSLAL